MEKENIRINKKDLFKGKAGISYLEIFILIAASFAFSYIVYQASKPIEQAYEKNNEQIKEFEKEKEKNNFLLNLIKAWISRSKIGIVSAQTNLDLSWSCCQESNNGTICQDVSSDYTGCKQQLIPSKCEQVSNCKLGCCFDSSEGLCSVNSPKQRCEQGNGNWTDNAACNILECRLGCCVIGQNTQFITEKRCEKLAGFYGLGLDFRQEVSDELSCLALSYSQVKGACIIGEGACKFTSKQECIRLAGIENFYENQLCSNPGLNTSCKKTENTGCVEGRNEVYFLDSCGNPANIYDSSKINNIDYWSRIYNYSESCAKQGESCGNCDYPLTKCGEGKANYGKFICKDLNCKNAPYLVDALGKVLKTKDRYNGESWCVYDSVIGQGKDVVGSRHWKYSCSEGYVIIEPCADFRQEICVENEIKEGKEDFSTAACVINRWRECLDYNNLANKTGNKINYSSMIEKCQENSDCYIKEIDFGEGYKISECLPSYPSGFDLNDTRRNIFAQQICSMGNLKCTKVMLKKFDWAASLGVGTIVSRFSVSGFWAGLIAGAAAGKWVCVAGCECGSKEFTQQMNEWCTSLGDCGGYVNILGKTDEGYSVTNAPKVNLNQYKNYTTPVAGKVAVPNNISELMKGMLGSNWSSDIYTGPSLMGALGTAIGFKGVELSLILIFGKGYPSQGVVALANLAPNEAQETVLSLLPNPDNFWAAFGNQFLGAVQGALATYFVIKAFGLQGDAAQIVAYVGAIGTTVILVMVNLSTVFSSFCGPLYAICFLILLVVLIIVAVIMKLFGIGDVKEIVSQYNCMPWQAPTGGQDCEKCGSDLKPCSNYRCESLGQGCQLLNEGTSEEKCTWITKNDSSAPIISPWQEILTPGYKYESQGEGFKLRQENGECIEAYTQVIFGISLSEAAQCKMDIKNLDYEDMGNYFGDNYYKDKHSLPFSSPSLQALTNQTDINYTAIIDNLGNLRFYVKCKDVNGNKNIKAYLIDICVKAGADLTAPLIVRANPASGSYIGFDANNQDIALYVNEPADCRYSLKDKKYEEMENNMTCLTGLQQASLYGWECQANLDLGKNTTFYFRCKDQPWLIENESKRNVNQQSYVYNLKKSSGALKINKIEPNGTMTLGVEPATINLKVETSGGAENGIASCSFRFTEDGTWIGFFNTNSNGHEQIFNQMLSGLHIIYVECEDVAGDTAYGQTRFKLNIDKQAPKIIRVYNSGGLKIITNEDAECVYSDSCNFVWENASEMSGLLREHTASWIIGASYYIKCKDLWDNKGSCFVVKTS